MSDNEKEKVEPEDDTTLAEATLIEDAEIVENLVDDEGRSEEFLEESGESEATTQDESADIAEEAPKEEAPAKSLAQKPRNPFIPMVVGGIVAGAIGFGAATYLNFGSGQNSAALAELSSKVDSQSSDLAAVSAELSRIEGLADSSGQIANIQAILAGLETKSAQAAETLGSQLASISNSVADIEKRVLNLEKRPMAEAFSDEAIAAYENEMAALREAIATHRADIESIAAEAREMEQAARQETVRSEGAAWVTEVSIALADGSSFSAPLEAIAAEGIAIPPALTAASGEGVATLAELVADFPPAARAALTAVRSEESEATGNSGFLTFLQNQVGARSVSPKEGDSADAVLSRAEAAAQDGDLATAIAELTGLSDVGQAAMAGWVMKAQQKQDVEAALDALRETVLNK